MALTASPDITQKVLFLSRRDAYPERPASVEIKETHMSWVFLTDAHAWKLKKPVRTKYLDFSTMEARWRNCQEEVRLNRRLSTGVYLGVVALTVSNSGEMMLDSQGQPVDWLVKMRRLPAKLMLDEAIAARTWTEDGIRGVGALLARFYIQSPPMPMTGAEYRRQLRGDLTSTRRDLIECKVLRELAVARSRKGLAFISTKADVLDERARSGRIVEAHGDLRPEHICLESPPAIVDCLEFNRTLRLLDPASELTYLALECDRLGAPRIGEILFEEYRQRTGDLPSDPLLAFYRNYHCCTRAKIALWHLRDPGTGPPSKWIARALDYLRR
jgi:aminoglycoside phosphotransferase family enzyme